MLADNAREDYFEESEKDVKGSSYAAVDVADYGNAIKGSAWSLLPLQEALRWTALCFRLGSSFRS